MDVELMPCPFCGGSPRLVQDGSWYVKCDCGVEGAYFYGDENTNAEQKAVQAWNHRIPSNVLAFYGKPYAYEVVAPDGYSTLLRAPTALPNHTNIPLYKIDINYES